MEALASFGCNGHHRPQLKSPVAQSDIDGVRPVDPLQLDAAPFRGSSNQVNRHPGGLAICPARLERRAFSPADSVDPFLETSPAYKLQTQQPAEQHASNNRTDYPPSRSRVDHAPMYQY
jgi:hypothetical protein